MASSSPRMTMCRTSDTGPAPMPINRPQRLPRVQTIAPPFQHALPIVAQRNLARHFQARSGLSAVLNGFVVLSSVHCLSGPHNLVEASTETPVSTEARSAARAERGKDASGRAESGGQSAVYNVPRLWPTVPPW